MSGGEWLPLTTLARSVGVPEASARRYAEAFPEHFQVRRMGKINAFHVDAGPVLKRISELFGQGMGRAQVADILRSEFLKTHELEQVPHTGDDPPPGQLPALVRAEIGTALAEALCTVANQQARLDSLEHRLAELEARPRPEPVASLWGRLWGKGRP